MPACQRKNVTDSIARAATLDRSLKVEHLNAA
jgi:hypothetical protein